MKNEYCRVQNSGRAPMRSFPHSLIPSFPHLLLALILLLTTVAWAQQPSRELDRKLFEPAEAGQGSPSGMKPSGDARTWDRELGAAAIAEDEQPLVDLAQRMHAAEQRIARGDCGAQTQQSQQQIVADLDRLIRQAQAQAQAAGPKPSAPGASKPGQDGTATAASQPSDQTGAGRKPGTERKGGQGGVQRPTAEQLATVFGQVWGELPEQARQQLLQQWSAEQFLPEYAPQIEQYFRRLTEAQERRP